MWRSGVLIVLAAATAAHASPKTVAAQLFEEGRALAGKAQFAEACEKFEESNKLDHAAGTEMNLGDCEEHLGHLAAAWRWFSDAAVLFADAHDSRVDYAKKRADLLEPRLGTIIVHLHHPGDTTITIAGREVKAQKKIRERVDPGVVEVRGESVTNGPFAKSVQVAAGATKTVRPDGRDEEPAGEPEPEPGPGPEAESPRTGWRVAFAGGVAVAAAGVGIYLYGHSQIDDARDQLCHGGAYQNMPNCQFPATITQQKVDQLNAQGDRGRTYAIAGELTAVVGLAFAAVAGYEGFLAHSSVVVAPAPGGASAAVSFAW